MTALQEQLIRQATEYIRSVFENDFSGHDYHHSLRVYRTAMALAGIEKADPVIVALAALLHDVDDRKLSPETSRNKDRAVSFLTSHGVEETDIRRIVTVIGEISFADSIVPSTLEGKCVQDADRLDALGAIGIARTFAYGGSHHRAMYDPDEKPLLNMDSETYRNHQSSSINHFYEKLFLLKDMMNTDTGRKLAVKRENYMKAFIDEFMLEWNGDYLYDALLPEKGSEI